MKALALTISGDFVPAARPLAGRVVVVKFGGQLIEDDAVSRSLLRQIIDIKKQGANVILVHGGGRQIDAELKMAGIEPKWLSDGRRDTDEQTLKITHRCLNRISTGLVLSFYEESSRYESCFASAGIGGHPDIIRAVPYIEGTGTRTGKVDFVDGEKILERADACTVPIIHSVCAGQDGGSYNVNADDVAAAIAIAVKADRLILCSNIPGVLDKDKTLISELSVEEVRGLINNGTIMGGMIPKIESAAMVASNPDVGGVVILNGFDPNSIREELLNENGSGTLIRRSAANAPKVQPQLANGKDLI